jgi:hypothetical protein
MTEQAKAFIFAAVLAAIAGTSLIFMFPSLPPLCVPVGQEDNGDGRIETLYLGKCQ